MSNRAREYRKRDNRSVIAVQLDLQFEQFNYQKWGDTQRALPGDWLVCNQGDTYTVDAEVFAKTYTQVAPGQYKKTATVWAWQASEQGAVKTIEGSTAFSAGDYLIADAEGAEPDYAISNEKFLQLYQPVE